MKIRHPTATLVVYIGRGASKEPTRVTLHRTGEKFDRSLLLRLPETARYAPPSLTNEGNRKVIIFTLGGKGSGMLGVMYTINRFPRSKNGVTLTCNECSHTVRVHEFDQRLGSPRTQAARAMLEHARNEHRKGPIGKPLPQIMER